MNQTSSPFLQRIRDEAEQNGYKPFDLKDQGLLVFPHACSTQHRIDLLQQLLMELRSASTPPATTTTSSRTTGLDCQVTVEERNQLFNFLQP